MVRKKRWYFVRRTINRISMVNNNMLLFLIRIEKKWTELNELHIHQYKEKICSMIDREEERIDLFDFDFISIC